MNMQISSLMGLGCSSLVYMVFASRYIIVMLAEGIPETSVVTFSCKEVMQ